MTSEKTRKEIVIPGETIAEGDDFLPGDWTIKTGIDLTMKQRESGLGKIKDGIIVRVNPHRVPRIIGKEGSMIRLIKEASGCYVTVGQNGLIWIRGDSVEGKIFAKQAIEFIVENTTTDGLTDKVEQWLKENRPKNLVKNNPIKAETSEMNGGMN